jgi:hypothetical protein
VIGPGLRDERHELVEKYPVPIWGEMQTWHQLALSTQEVVDLESHKNHLTIREEPPQHCILFCILAPRHLPGTAFDPASFSHHGAPYIAHLHVPLFANLPNSLRVTRCVLSCASQTTEARNVTTVGGTQHTLIDRRRCDEDNAKVRSAGEMGVREDGVKVGGEEFQRDVLLRTTWGVRQARVVGTLMGENVSSLSACDAYGGYPYRRKL